MRKEVYYKYGESFESFIYSKLSVELKEPHYIAHHLKVYSARLKRDTEIDILLVAQFGIYCIEAKRYRTSIEGRMNDNVWIGSSGRYKTRFYNPVLQNCEHIRSLKRLLRQVGVNPPQIYNLICVPNECEIKSDARDIYSIGSLYSVIGNDSVMRSKHINVNVVKKLLEENCRR